MIGWFVSIAMTLNFKKRVLVSGSSRGLGFAIAESFQRSGASVVTNGRSGGVAVTEACLAVSDGYVSGDVSTENGAQEVVNGAISILGGLDVLVCNVGVSSGPPPGTETEKDWSSALKSNLFSAVNMSTAAKAHLNKSNGVIVCISSICGLETIDGAPYTYSIAKSALNTYIKMTSRHYASLGIRIVGLAPGNLMFDGSVWDKKLQISPEETKKNVKNNVPLNCFGSADEVAEVVKLLCSDSAAFVTGTVWTMDGGQTRKFN